MTFSMWTPISLAELEEWISKGESKLEGEPLNFWNLSKIAPQKWQEAEYGGEGGGFWVVAIFGNAVIYYNEIEEASTSHSTRLMVTLVNIGVSRANLIEWLNCFTERSRRKNIITRS